MTVSSEEMEGVLTFDSKAPSLFLNLQEGVQCMKRPLSEIIKPEP